MSLATASMVHSATQLDITHPSLLALIAQLESGFENPEGISGRCLMALSGEARSGDATSVDALHIRFNKEGLRFSARPIRATCLEALRQGQFDSLDAELRGEVDAFIQMPTHVADKIIEDIEHVDYRDPDIIGSMIMQGDLHLVNHIAKALVRPSKSTKATLDDATQRVHASYRGTDILTLDNPSELAILEQIALKQPFVIKNAPITSDHSQWSLERLAKDYGDVPLRVRSATEQESVGEFVRRLQQLALNGSTEPVIEGHTKAYTEGCQLPYPMIKDFLPPYFTTHDYTPPQIWLGAVPVNVPASSLHRDPLDGFLYQLMGRKKVIMFAPDQAKYLYPMRAYNNYQPCWAKPEEQDFDVFPLFAAAQSIEVVLNPGEILVQPAGWFHAVYCLDSPTFSVSYFLNEPVGVAFDEDVS